jgi:hydroxymethylglutaryl-CoA synthase
VGDWNEDPAQGRSLTSDVPASGPPEYSVSQGAFVPAPRYEESRPSRWGFVAERCPSCSHRTFPARGRCRGCGEASGLRQEPLPLHGATVVASTWIGPGGQPTEFDGQVEATGPYGVVLAEIAPDVRVTLQVADARPADVRVGAKVDTVLRRLYPIEGAWRYGRKAVPAYGGR